MQPKPLTVLRGGINRLKVRGGARADMLYDLVNAYITNAGTVSPREGTIRAAALTGQTVGLAATNGKFNVFSKTLVSVPTGYICNLLIHPTDATQSPTKIWFAKPFLGFLYVVAQFGNGDVFHYWLQNSGTWTANTVYKTSAVILPSTPNGLAAVPERIMPPNANWTSDSAVSLGQVVEPTEYTGFIYRIVAIAGTTPHTSATEPVWPTTIGGIIQEFGDFDTSSTDSGTTQATPSSTAAQPLDQTITDRYGNSADVSGSAGTASTIATTVAASTAVTTWAPGTLYAPGAVVQPSTSQGAFINAIPNGDFENGDDGNWTKQPVTGTVVFDSTHQYQGNFCVAISCDHGESSATMNNFGVITPGQSVTASCYVDPHNTGSNYSGIVALRFYDSGDTFMSEVRSAVAQNSGYRKISVTATAPTGAAHVRVRIIGGTGTSTKTGFFDLVSWNLETPAAVSNFLFEAIQAVAGSSGTTEPTWPTVAGNTVVDNGVTWKAIGTSIITWQAIPIMLSGNVEPTWQTTVGLSAIDISSYTSQDGHVTNTSFSWRETNRQITDSNNPNTTAVAIGASHVFAGNNDICSFSAAVDPTDWTSSSNAGYLPTGLNNYGDNPVAMLALYRSNLVVFNSGGYQMYQIDPDPANMALLDAEPVGSIYTRSAQSVSNDLLFLTEVGVRNLGTVGGTANLQVGSTGQPVDPIVVAALQAGTYDPLSLYYPGRGQYWLIFGPQAFVVTINGAGVKSWSRFIFPDTITDWTLNAGKLYLRTAGNLVWQLDALTLVDDFNSGGGAGGANTPFLSWMQWPYLDVGVLGINKMLVGLDLSGTGSVTIQIAHREDDPTTFIDNAGFNTSLNVTAPYTISLADTVPGTPIPIPVDSPSYSVILIWGTNQAWSWQAANLYLTESRGGGSTG